MNNCDIELEDLIYKIFTNEPKPINSINITFDNIELKELFERLLEIFTKGMKIKYGDENGIVDLSKLKNEELIIVNKYFNSFGINLNFSINEPTLENYTKFEKLKYKNIVINNNTKLRDLHYPLISNNLIYCINFDLI